MTTFDFSGLKSNVPRGWLLVTADAAEFRMRKGPREIAIRKQAGEFCLYSRSRNIDKEDVFMMRSNDMQRMFRLVGLL